MIEIQGKPRKMIEIQYRFDYVNYCWLHMYIYIYRCYIYNYIYTPESNYICFYSHEMVCITPQKVKFDGNPLWTPAQKAEKAKWLEIFQRKSSEKKRTHSYTYIYIYIHSVLVEQKHKMCLTQMPFIYQESVTLDVNVYLPIQNTLPKWGNVEAL